MILGQSNQSLLLGLARFLERTAYYGIRAMIVIYAIEQLNLSRSEALGFYGTMTSITYLSMIFAGVISDLTKGTKWVALAGGLFQIIGVLCFISGDLNTVIIGGLFFAVGSGSYVVASLSAFARSQFGKLKTLHSGWTIYYVFINAGAFLGSWYTGIYMEGTGPYNFNAILYTSIPIIALGAIFTFINTPKFPKVRRKSNTSPGRDIVLIALTVPIVSIFWTCIEAFGGQIALWSRQLTLDDPNLNPLFTLDLYMLSVLIIGVIFFVFWSFFKTSSLRLLSIAFMIAACAYVTLIFHSNNTLGLYNALFLHTVTLTAAEVIIIPIVLSIQNMHSNPRFLGIIMGGYLLGVSLLNSYILRPFTPNFGEIPIKWGLIIIAIVLLVIAIVWFILQFFFKDRFSFELVIPEKENTLDLKEDEILD